MAFAIVSALFLGFVAGVVLMGLVRSGAEVTELAAHAKLRLAAMAVLAIRPTNWDDDEDPEQARAWRNLETALRVSPVRRGSTGPHAPGADQ